MASLPPQDVHDDPDLPWWRRRAQWFYAALLAGDLSDHAVAGISHFQVSVEHVGTIPLPGGEFVAADYLVASADSPPFTQRFAAEKVSVLAARALVGEQHERIAALILRAPGAVVRTWDIACLPGQDPASLHGEQFFGYPVDAGVGCFASPSVMAVVEQVTREDDGMLEDPMSTAIFEDGRGTRAAAVVVPDPDALPIAVCSAGWGDGLYPTWLGLDDAGNLVTAVTDFMLTDDPFIVREAPASEPPATPPPKPAPEPTSWWRRLLGS